MLGVDFLHMVCARRGGDIEADGEIYVAALKFQPLSRINLVLYSNQEEKGRKRKTKSNAKIFEGTSIKS